MNSGQSHHAQQSFGSHGPPPPVNRSARPSASPQLSRAQSDVQHHYSGAGGGTVPHSFLPPSPAPHSPQAPPSPALGIYSIYAAQHTQVPAVPQRHTQHVAAVPHAAPPPISRASKPPTSPAPNTCGTLVNKKTLQSDPRFQGPGSFLQKTQSSPTLSRVADQNVAPKVPFKLSKGKRPEVRNHRSGFKELQDGGTTSLLSVLSSPPVVAMRLERCHCAEVLLGKMYDAMYEEETCFGGGAELEMFNRKRKTTEQLAAEEKKSKSLNPFAKKPTAPMPLYRVDLMVPCDRERYAKETHVGEIRMYKYARDMAPEGSYAPNVSLSRQPEIVALLSESPCMSPRPGVYFFRKQGPRFFLLEMAETVTRETIDAFELLLLEFGLFHRMNPNKEYDSNWQKASDLISSGGAVVGSGLAKTSALLGKGMRMGTSFYTSNTKKSDPSLNLTPEERRRQAEATKTLETAEQASTYFVCGVRTVKHGINKGAKMVGRTGVQVADTTHKAYKGTDYHQKKQMMKPKKVKSENEKLRDKTLSGMLDVAKNSVYATSNVLSGAKQATRTVVRDAADTSVAVTEHNHGKVAADQWATGLSCAGKAGLGSAFCMGMYSTEVWHLLAYTGVGAATYDPDKRELLKGIAWMTGWVTKQGSFMNPWSPRFCILRTYSMAFYKNTAISDITGPSSYINLDEVINVSAELEASVGEAFCFSVQTKSELLYFSLDMRGKKFQGEDWKYDAQELDRKRFEWMNTIQALSQAIAYSKYKRL